MLPIHPESHGSILEYRREQGKIRQKFTKHLIILEIAEKSSNSNFQTLFQRFLRGQKVVPPEVIKEEEEGKEGVGG